jgi:hypothetical protein
MKYMKKQLSFLLWGTVLSCVLLTPLSVFAQADANAQIAAKNKAKVETLGVGTTVSIRLQNKRKLKGQITRLNPDDFIIDEIESGKQQTLTYSEVAQIKRAGSSGMSTGVKLALVGVGIVFVLSYIGNVLRD